MSPKRFAGPKLGTLGITGCTACMIYWLSSTPSFAEETSLFSGASLNDILFVVISFVAVLIVIAIFGFMYRGSRQGAVSEYSGDERKINASTAAISASIGVFAVLGEIAIIVASYGLVAQDRSFAASVGINTLLGAAGASVGAIIGFLFGIPRTLDPASRAAVAGAAQQGGAAERTNAVLAANTNLERVSDWLTTLLLGATLVEIKDISTWLTTTAKGFSTSAEAATAVIPLVLIYFFALGFLGVYLITRLFLTSAFTNTLGLVVTGAGVSDTVVLGNFLSRSQALTDPEAIKNALAIYDSWNLNQSEKASPEVNAGLSQLLLAYLRTGKASDVPGNLKRVREALALAAKSPDVARNLRAEFSTGKLTSGDKAVDSELGKIVS